MIKDKELEIKQPQTNPEVFPSSPPEFKPYENPLDPEKSNSDK